VSGPPALPGGIGLSGLSVYPWRAADGLCGGSPHLHLCCTEAYLVLSGRGRLQTLTAAGAGEHRLDPGDLVWFGPGTIHRAVDDGGLEVAVVMANSGLPEAGDAVLTFPPEHLADLDRYRRARDLTGPDGAPDEQRARERRDLAVAGFTTIRTALLAGDRGPLERFHAAAAALVTPLLEDWRKVLCAGAGAAVERSADQIAALAAGDHRYLADAGVARAVRAPEPSLGMCGYLSSYPTRGPVQG